MGSVEYRAQEVSSPTQIVQRQLHEEVFVTDRRVRGRSNGLVVCRAPAYGFVENRGIRRDTTDRPVIDELLQRAAVEQIARDVVEPEALPKLLQLPGVHGADGGSSVARWRRPRAASG